MIAIDTNLLVYSHRQELPLHAPSLDTLRALFDGGARCAIPWPCVHEFLAVVTNPRIFKLPTPLEQALAHVGSWTECPSMTLIGEGADHMDHLAVLLKAGRVQGAAIHDARVAAICLSHGVTELWSVDRDFTRFPRLKVRNPLRGS